MSNVEKQVLAIAEREVCVPGWVKNSYMINNKLVTRKVLVLDKSLARFLYIKSRNYSGSEEQEYYVNGHLFDEKIVLKEDKIGSKCQ